MGIITQLISGRHAKRGAEAEQKFQMGIQEKTWEREDTSVQRRVADLKAAGLSPTLAAGQGAQAGVPSAGMAAGEAAGEVAGGASAKAIEKISLADEYQKFARTKVDTDIQKENLKKLRWENDVNAAKNITVDKETGKETWTRHNLYQKSILEKLNRIGIDRYRVQLLNESTSFGNIQAQYDIELSRIKVNYRYKGLSMPEMQVVALGVAVERLKQNKLMADMNIGFYARRNVPPALLGPISGIAQKVIGGVLR